MAEKTKISEVSPFSFAAIIVGAALVTGVIILGARKGFPSLFA